MAHCDSGIGCGAFLHQHGCQRLAHDVAAAYYYHALALCGYVVAL